MIARPPRAGQVWRDTDRRTREPQFEIVSIEAGVAHIRRTGSGSLGRISVVRLAQGGPDHGQYRLVAHSGSGPFKHKMRLLDILDDVAALQGVYREHLDGDDVVDELGRAAVHIHLAAALLDGLDDATAG